MSDVAQCAKWWVYRFIISQDKENVRDFSMYPIVFQSWLDVSKDAEGDAIYGFYGMYPTNIQNNLHAMNEWNWYHCPWYMEFQGWTTPFDQNEKVAYQKHQITQTPKAYFNDVKLGPKTDNNIEEKFVGKIDAIDFIKFAIMDRSWENKVKPKQPSDLVVTGGSKKGIVFHYFCLFFGIFLQAVTA